MSLVLKLYLLSLIVCFSIYIEIEFIKLLQISKMWFRSSPAELYYKAVEDGSGVQQTAKLEKICETFYQQLIERGRNARPEVDELPPLRPSKVAMCKHKCEFLTCFVSSYLQLKKYMKKLIE